jgi:ribosomal protein S18 acetylase RimI-like enzyme
MDILKVANQDLPKILELQKICYYASAVRYNTFDIPPMQQTLENLEQEFQTSLILKAQRESEIIGSIRAYEKEGTCFIGRVIVHPEAQNRGIGKSLMRSIEHHFPSAHRYELFTGYRDGKNLYFYQSLGYTLYKEEELSDRVKLVYLEKKGQGIHE